VPFVFFAPDLGELTDLTKQIGKALWTADAATGKPLLVLARVVAFTFDTINTTLAMWTDAFAGTEDALAAPASVVARAVIAALDAVPRILIVLAAFAFAFLAQAHLFFFFNSKKEQKKKGICISG
jgi:hypothetical protein